MKKLMVISIVLAFITLNVNSQTNTFPATGNVGIGTTTPSILLHLKKSDTPAIKLEQDNSGGWTAQTWDIAGNEANFFIRDVTNSSLLPFRIQPNTPTSTLTLKSGGRVGVGSWSPLSTLDVFGTLRIAYDSTLTFQGGMIRYYKNDFKGYNGTEWVSFTKPDSLTILHLQNQIDSLKTNNLFLYDGIAYLTERIDSLQARLDICCPLKAQSINDPIDKAILEQNNPNPFNQNTQINFYIPQNVNTALLLIHDLTGKQLLKFTINDRGKSNISIQAALLTSGMYSYTLLLDGKIIGTKKMILTD